MRKKITILNTFRRKPTVRKVNKMNSKKGEQKYCCEEKKKLMFSSQQGGREEQAMGN